MALVVAPLFQDTVKGEVPVPGVITLLADPSQLPGQVSSLVVEAVMIGPSGTTTVIVVLHTSVPFPYVTV